MKKALIYFIIGTIVSFLINYFLSDSNNVKVDLYYAFAFGLGWGIAYYLDTPRFKLPMKLIISLGGVMVLVVLGFLIFNAEIAIPSIIRFSTVFVAYYLIASFRPSKSLRQ